MSNARDKANIPALNFSSTGIDDNATSTAITIDSSENVGIGISNPTSPLHIKNASNPKFHVITASPTASYNAGFLVSAGNSASPSTRYVTLALDADGGDGSGSDNFTIKKIGGSPGNVELTQEGSANILFKTADTERMRINSSGSVTKPNQPAFLANRTTGTQENLAPNDVIIFPNERYDQQSNFSSNTFTAPVTGKYHFSFVVSVQQLDYDATFNRIILNTSNKGYNFSITASQQFNGANPTYYAFQGSLTVDMDSGDTAFLKFSQSGGDSTADVFDSTYFSGYLVC